MDGSNPKNPEDGHQKLMCFVEDFCHLVFPIGKILNKEIEIDFVGPYFGLHSLKTHARSHLVSEWDCIPVSEMTGNLGQIISITVFLPLSTRFSFPSLPTLRVHLQFWYGTCINLGSLWFLFLKAQQRALATQQQQDDMHRWPPSPRAARWYSMML